MIYKQYASNPPLDTPLWAFAYEIDENTNRCRLKCTPIRGEIIKRRPNRRRYTYASDVKFHPYLKDGKTLAQSSVNHTARIYADTEQEAIAAYNELVANRIKRLQTLIDEAKTDFLEPK